MVFGHLHRPRSMADPAAGTPSTVLHSGNLSSRIPSCQTRSSLVVGPTHFQVLGSAIPHSAVSLTPLCSSTQYLVTFIVLSRKIHSLVTRSTVRFQEGSLRPSPCWPDHLSVFHVVTCSLSRVPLAVCFPVGMAVGLLKVGLPRRSMVSPRPSAYAETQRATSMSCTNFPMEPSAAQ